MSSEYLKLLSDVFLQMLECLEELHNAGYVHYDVKPENFRIDPNEIKVYIIDFGLTKSYLND